MAAEASGQQASEQPTRDYLLDISRLLWRFWSGRLPTGIDRVCLAYVERFAGRSLAVIQRKGIRLVLSQAASDRIFSLLLSHPQPARRSLASGLAKAIPAARARPPRPEMVYLNVGHTGLDDQSLLRWLGRHRLRAVYLIHDLIPITHPEYCRPGEAAKHRRRMTNALLSARGIIGNSNATIRELEAFAKSAGLNMPAWTSAWIGSDTLSAAERPSPPVSGPYFVTLGTIEGRKNHVLLLQIWQRLAKSMGEGAPRLVIIGQRGWETGHALSVLDRHPSLKHYVLEINRCTDLELAGWLHGARALLMPSFAEGFGLPVVEGLQAGIPVIASSLDVFREIAGDIPTYLDPLDGPSWERAISAFIREGSDRERQRREMKEYRAPTWEIHFRTVEPWLRRLD